MVEASFTGLVKTVLLIIGAMVALRFIGRLMIAKRNLEEERELLNRERSFQRERNEKLRNFGKIKVEKSNQQTTGTTATEDVDFEEV
ncbi:MAG: hypothetical protein HYZ43_05705 [Flavobacteriia bacterium]|nr:hypothetical protein [Flavobacteriia bacterium]